MLALMVPVAELLPRSLGPYATLMAVGFLIGIFGHLARSRWMVAIGILMIFCATLVFPLVRNATEDDPPAAEGERLPGVP